MVHKCLEGVHFHHLWGCILQPMLPFGEHLAPAVKEKIWMGEYVDMFSLLLQEPKPKTRECPWAVQGTKKTMVERNWYNLMCGYTTYAGVVIQKKGLCNVQAPGHNPLEPQGFWLGLVQ